MRLQEKERFPGAHEVDAAVDEHLELQEAARIKGEITSIAHRMQLLLDA